MKNWNQPLSNCNHEEEVKPEVLFSSEPQEDRKDIEKEEDEDEPATMDDWGDVDPAGGPAPSAPGSAI